MEESCERGAAKADGAAAAMPAASQPVTPWPVSGLASWTEVLAATPSHACAQWRMSQLVSLTVAGAVPE